MKFQLIASSLFCMRSVHGFIIANVSASTSSSGLALIRTNNKPTAATTTRTSSEALSNDSHNHSSSALHASTLKDTFSSILIGAFIGASAMNINANPAHATDTSLLPSSSSSSSLVLLQSSSSIHISKTITTMEFSLPSSYDTISSATASGTNELTVETDTITNTSRKKVVSSPSSTSSDNNNNGFSLPSFGGGGGNSNDNSNLSDEERAALAAERKAEREALALLKSAEREAIATEKAAEKEAIAQMKSAERDAIAQQQAEDNERLAIQRQKEKVERKEAALVQKAVQDEKSASKASNSKFKGAEFVDFSMPSYDKAGVDGQKDSVFAL